MKFIKFKDQLGLDILMDASGICLHEVNASILYIIYISNKNLSLNFSFETEKERHEKFIELEKLIRG